MDKQTYAPNRPDMAHLMSPEEQQANAEKRAQFDRLLDEYRHRYVLRTTEPDEKPSR
jgi:hypothetical protein